jgi:hypothetical protein
MAGHYNPEFNGKHLLTCSACALSAQSLHPCHVRLHFRENRACSTYKATQHKRNSMGHEHTKTRTQCQTLNKHHITYWSEFPANCPWGHARLRYVTLDMYRRVPVSEKSWPFNATKTE